MTDQPFYDAQRRTRASQAVNTTAESKRPATESKISFWTSLDKPLILIVIVLMVIGSGMVYSATFDWSYQERGSNTAFFVEVHLRNVVIALAAMAILTVVDYRFWKRFAIFLLLATIAALLAVTIFGDDVYGARRTLIAGSLQPGELAAFSTVVYLAAWLGSKNTRPQSLTYLLLFGFIVGIITAPLAIQPDISTALIIGVTAFVMFFLAGARLWHLGVLVVVSLILGVAVVQVIPYAKERVDSYFASVSDPTRANYHTQQAIIAFVNGGWLGRGLGQGQQKFGFLPAPHTDSIFAVIGEELGVVGAGVVLLLFVAFVARGFQVARRAVDPFGALLVIGFTIWVAVQAMLNIAVMTNVVPSSGLPLPFISYGGSSLIALMMGVGLMLSVSRIATLRQNSPSRGRDGATYDRGWGNRRTRLSRLERRRDAPPTERP